MLRVLFISIPFLLIACSKDKPAPVAPVGKAMATLAAPPAPTNLRFEAVTDSSCRVRWDAAEGATDYDVNYKPAVGGRWTNEPHKGVRLYNTIYDLEPNTEYRWAVRAENRDGPSQWVFGENFTTEKVTGLNIVFSFEENVPQIDRDAFNRAARRWREVVLNDITIKVIVRQEPKEEVEGFSPPVFGYLRAYAELFELCSDGFPKEGRITYDFDRDRLARRAEEMKEHNSSSRWEHVPPPEWTIEEEVNTRIEDVATHEIGHILGIGILDNWFDLVKPPDYWDDPLRSLNAWGDPDLLKINFYFAGPAAWRGFRQIQKALEQYSRYQPSENFLWYGQAPPVADDKHHWRGTTEDTHDIMGSTQSSAYHWGTLPRYISPLIRGTLQDMGYSIDLVTHVLNWDEEGLLPITPVAAAPKPSVGPPIFICTIAHRN